MSGCDLKGSVTNSIELITDRKEQDSIFHHLMALTRVENINLLKDSVAFLVLPMQASCPACREKTIDSIVIHQHNLVKGRYIILSAKGGKKTISSFFKERDKELPAIDGRLFLDSTNEATKYNLIDEKPTAYYAHGGRVYKKVASVPMTVKEDLHEFFSGTRIQK